MSGPDRSLRRHSQDLDAALLLLALAAAGLARKPGPGPKLGLTPATGELSQDMPPCAAVAEAGRGREAETPLQVTALGWKDIGLRVWRRMGRDNVTLVAAGVAFYLLLAVFPALGAFVSGYALVADTNSIQGVAAEMSSILPPEASKLLLDTLRGLIAKANSKLSLGVVVGLLVALWSARSSMAALMTGLNIANEEVEKRGFLEQQLVAVAMTLGAILFAGVTLTALGLIPLGLALLPLDDTTRAVLAVARWPILALFMMVGLAVIYRIAPSRREARWRWVSWGAVGATLLWLAASAVFSLYVSRFASYDATYGSLGAVVVLLLWFWLSALIVLVGATVNAEAEHQTLRDTTRGRPKPIGERGARMADTVGSSSS